MQHSTTCPPAPADGLHPAAARRCCTEMRHKNADDKPRIGLLGRGREELTHGKSHESVFIQMQGVRFHGA